MKKTILFIAFFLVISFSLAQTVPVDVNLIRQLIEVLQKLVQGGGVQPVQPLTPTPATGQPAACPLISPDTSQGLEMCLKSAKALEEKYPGCKYVDACYKSGVQPPTLESKESRVAPFLPRGVEPAIQEAKPITPEVLRPILPDENREDDYIVQLNNLRITRIVTSTPDAKAIFFAVRDADWRCLLFESEESPNALPCIIDIRRPIAWRELAIKITDETILLLRNRQRAKLEDFKVNDKINVYGFMDKDNFGVEALIIRNLGLSKPILTTPPILMPPIKPPISTTLPAINSISGYLTKAEVSIYMWGTHQLKGDDGKVYQVKANNVETSALLDKYSGKRVKIYGKVEYQTMEGGFWSIIAEKIELIETKTEIESTTQAQSLTQTQSVIELRIEADDYGFYPSSIEVRKGSTVILTFVVKNQNVYYGGLDFRSDKFKTDPVKPGQTITVKFIADQDFVVSSYWPLSNVKKADLKILVK